MAAEVMTVHVNNETQTACRFANLRKPGKAPGAIRVRGSVVCPHHAISGNERKVPAVGVEPTLPYGNKILSLARLPISPRWLY